MKNLVLSLLLGSLLVGCVDAEGAPQITPRDLPDDVASWTYVASGVSAASANGSALNPYPSVQAAIDAAPAGGGVIIQAGTYEGALTVNKDIVLSGLPTASEEVVLSATSAAQVLSISGGAVVRIEDLRIRGNQDAVLDVNGEGTALRLTDVMLDCTPNDELEDPPEGHGLVVSNGADVSVYGGHITGCARYGVFVDSSKIVLDQMAFVSDHVGGGLRLEAALPGSEIRNAVIESNQGFGVGLFCGELSIINSSITRTTNPGGGDGVVASVLTSLLEDDPRIGCSTDLIVGGDSESYGNTIENNQRAGIIVDGDVTALIQNNELNFNGNGGIWLVGGSASQTRKVEVFENTVISNLHVGIGVVHQAIATVAGNQVWDTLPIDDFSGETSHGDGVFVEDAISEVFGNVLRRNLRYGILMRAPIQGSCIGNDNAFEENFGGLFKWEVGESVDVNYCLELWSKDEGGLPECPEGEPCPQQEQEQELPELTCEDPTCLVDPLDPACPIDCSSDGPIPGKKPGDYNVVTNQDCSGCWGGEGPPCPNDSVAEGEELTCCKPNSMDGLGVDNHSASPEES